mmetsp:Transcript_4032/g.6838  ORF Transcript_4032/g.6838 Transcript_4032/m.6838 type:complete len:137 (+) Transcript_4032:48-458(+)
MNRIARATVSAFRPRVAQRMARVPTTFAFVRQPVQFSVRSFGAAGGMETEGEPFLDVSVVTERVVEVVKSFEKVDPSKVSAAARFKEDLDLDSLDAVEIALQLEEEFSIQIPDSEADNILSIPDAVKYISGHPMAR